MTTSTIRVNNPIEKRLHAARPMGLARHAAAGRSRPTRGRSNGNDGRNRYRSGRSYCLECSGARRSHRCRFHGCWTSQLCQGLPVRQSATRYHGSRDSAKCWRHPIFGRFGHAATSGHRRRSGRDRMPVEKLRSACEYTHAAFILSERPGELQILDDGNTELLREA